MSSPDLPSELTHTVNCNPEFHSHNSVLYKDRNSSFYTEWFILMRPRISNLPMKTKLDSIVYFATLTRKLSGKHTRQLKYNNIAISDLAETAYGRAWPVKRNSNSDNRAVWFVCW
jgi:hypothetical protein